MPKQRKPQPLGAARHVGPPEHAPRVIEGTIRPLPVQVADGVQPLGAVWVDGQTGMVVGYALIDPRQSPDNGTTEALGALEQALESPTMLGPSTPGLYVPGGQGPAIGVRRSQQAIVVRTDRRLAAAAQIRLARLPIRVETADELPLFSLAFEELTQSLAESESAEPFNWEIDQALLAPLFQAAAEYVGREPWSYLLDQPPLAVDLGPQSPLPGVATLYGSVLGAGGEVYGVAYYLSLDQYMEALQTGTEAEQASAPRDLNDQEVAAMVDHLRTLGAPVDTIPPELLRGMLEEAAGTEGSEPPRQEAIVCFYDSQENTNPSYVEWLEELGIEFDDDEEIPVFLRTGHQFDPRPPTDQETQAVIAALSATNQFLAAHQRTLQRHPYTTPAGGLRHTAHLDNQQPVEVQWPASGFEMLDGMLPG